ncbi:hypothetical protein A2Y68_00185 [Candidatus Woesebacteria bacterium RBG_13_46_13]|uniref:VOC domain-containing protein n=1 Tax=Candidatus Woesebacteria bacterium RBG_13_46_13 TaxID=1802479 RepID=A0A1F7X2S1_9BACT|nr:MAG: hypothetical protein A2Y68_00185 [Candidatus Woesebacteria bacterium RBG_13_46_13]
MDISDRKSSFAGKATGIPNAHLKIAYLKGENCYLELVEYVNPKGKKLNSATNNIGSAHICFEVNDFLNFIVRFKLQGGLIISDPLVIPAGPNKGRYMVYAKDPDGNNIEFISSRKVRK